MLITIRWSSADGMAPLLSHGCRCALLADARACMTTSLVGHDATPPPRLFPPVWISRGEVGETRDRIGSKMTTAYIDMESRWKLADRKRKARRWSPPIRCRPSRDREARMMVFCGMELICRVETVRE